MIIDKIMFFFKGLLQHQSVKFRKVLHVYSGFELEKTNISKCPASDQESCQITSKKTKIVQTGGFGGEESMYSRKHTTWLNIPWTYTPSTYNLWTYITCKLPGHLTQGHIPRWQVLPQKLSLDIDLLSPKSPNMAICTIAKDVAIFFYIRTGMGKSL